MNPTNLKLHLDQAAAELRTMADQLVMYTYPMADPGMDSHTEVLRSRSVVVDGYDILVTLARSDYRDHYQETVKIQATAIPFLPFFVVLKVGRRLLGDHHLSLLEVYREDRKMYVWTLKLDKQGRPMPQPFAGGSTQKYGGVEYTYLDESQVTTR